MGVAPSHLGLLSSLCRSRRALGRCNPDQRAPSPALAKEDLLYATRPKPPAQLIRATRSSTGKIRSGTAGRRRSVPPGSSSRSRSTTMDCATREPTGPQPITKSLLDYNDQAKANVLSASHIAAQSPSDNSVATTNMARAFIDRNAKQADRSDCEGPFSLFRL